MNDAQQIADSNQSGTSRDEDDEQMRARAATALQGASFANQTLKKMLSKFLKLLTGTGRTVLARDILSCQTSAEIEDIAKGIERDFLVPSKLTLFSKTLTLRDLWE